MLAIAALAVQIPDVAHGESTGFVIAYVVLRSLMVGLYLRSYRHVPSARPLIARYAAGYSLGIALWLVSLLFPAPARYVLWGVALAWEYSLPVRFRRFHSAIPVSTSHVPERFGLFTIIVFGETIVAVALGTEPERLGARGGARGRARLRRDGAPLVGVLRHRRRARDATHGAGHPRLHARAHPGARGAHGRERRRRARHRAGFPRRPRRRSPLGALRGSRALPRLPYRGAAGAHAGRLAAEGDRAHGRRSRRSCSSARWGRSLQPWVFVAAVAALLLALVTFEMWAYRQAQLTAG